MKRYCIEILTPVVNPMDNEIRHTTKAYFFDTKEQAERFKKESRRAGMKTSAVIDLENLPF